MKKKVAILIIFSLGLLIGLNPTQATSGPYQWAMTYDTSVGERDHAYAVKQTPDGGFIVAGGTDSFPYDDFDYSMWIIKLKPDGSVAWQKSLEGGSARTIELTHDGGYIVAGSYYTYREPDPWDDRAYWSDMWVIKLDADGNVIWQKTYGEDYNESVHSIIQSFDSEGNFEGYVAAGSTAECYPECDDFLIVKLDPVGNVLFQKKYEFEAWEGIRAIQQTQDGGYFVAGSNHRDRSLACDEWHGDVCVMRLESDLDVVWQYNYGGCNSDDARSMVLTEDGGCIVAGNTNSFGADADFWVLKLAFDGSIVWQKTYGGDDDDCAKSIEETRDGGYIVAGDSGWDIELLKLDSGGDIVWDKTYGGSEWDTAYAVQQTEDGEYIMAGYTRSFGADTFDYLVLKVNAMGEIPNCDIIGTGAFSASNTLVVPEESAAEVSDTEFDPVITTADPEENDFETLSICAGCVLCEDQINDVDTGTSVGCGGPNSLFQSFIPNVSSLPAVDLRLRAGGSFPNIGYETTINIREATTDGAVLATATTLVPGPQDTGAQIDVRFNFSPEIVLTPGNVYVIEWIETDNDTILTWMRAEGDTYTDGNAFGCGGMNPIVDKDFIFTTFYCCTPNTPSGFNIFVQLDPAVSVRYPRVDLAGMTALKELLEGPPPELGYYIGSPLIYYDVTTTAVFTGLIEITVDYNGISFTNEAALGLFHYKYGCWNNITSSLDTAAKMIYGETGSLSLFAIFEKDVQAPELHVSVSPETLWPPNHKMVHIETAITVTDDHDLNPTVELKAITMDEGDGTNTYDPQYDNTPGDGNTVEDIQVDEDGNIYLRAERSGKGDGRVYTITFTATDASGNEIDASAEVTVPHNQ